MRKAVILGAVVALVASMAISGEAKADTDIYVGFGGYPSYTSSWRDGHDRHGRGHGHYKHHRRDVHYWQRPVVYAPPPVYVTPAPVVYQTTYVQPRQQYVMASSFPADQSSPTFLDNYGRTCREYTSQSWIGGRSSSVYGTACLQPDGAWRIVD